MQQIVIQHLSGNRASQRQRLLLDPLVGLLFGRDPPCEVRFEDPDHDVVSRRHARLAAKGGDRLEFTLSDLDSANGLFINEQRVSGHCPLHRGDVVRLGLSGPAFVFEGLAAAGESEAQTQAAAATDMRLSGTTRYIAAGVYHDAGFRERVLRDHLEQPYRAVAPSYGCHLPTVLAHCLRARRKELLRDGAIVLLGLALLLTHPGVLQAALEQTSADPDGPQMPPALGDLLRVLALGVLGSFVLVWLDRMLTEFAILPAFSPQAWTRQTPVAAREAPEAIGADAANVVVYSDFAPFVGSGQEYNAWSFTLNTTRGTPGLAGAPPATPRRFAVGELYDFITRRLQGLDGLTVRDKLFVDGRRIRDDPRFLPDLYGHPVRHLDPATLASFRHGAEQTARFYKEAQVVDWNGQIVFTLFLRFLLTREHLFAEANYLLLPPLLDKFYRIDEQSPSASLSRIWQLSREAAVLAPLMLILAPLALLGALGSPLHRHLRLREQRKLIRRNPMFNRGAPPSVREAASQPRYRSFFQRLDVDRHVKTLEREVLDGILDFLLDHDIDTADLQQRQTTIMSNGVIVSGGSVQAQNMAVGDKAAARSVLSFGRRASGGMAQG